MVYLRMKLNVRQNVLQNNCDTKKYAALYMQLTWRKPDEYINHKWISANKWRYGKPCPYN